jgi:peptidoglycan-associated lipoprotein
MLRPKSITRQIHLITTCLTLATLALAGCHGNLDKEIVPPPSTTHTGGAEKTQDSEKLPEIETGAIDFNPIDTLHPVYFGYDSAALDAAAQADVRTAYEVLFSDEESLVQVAGHCDERGTQEYNLALGERRAQSVRNRLRELGIPGSRIVTISYGEERPAASGSDEAAWTKNRRCEFQSAGDM